MLIWLSQILHCLLEIGIEEWRGYQFLHFRLLLTLVFANTFSFLPNLFVLAAIPVPFIDFGPGHGKLLRKADYHDLAPVCVHLEKLLQNWLLLLRHAIELLSLASGSLVDLHRLLISLGNHFLMVLVWRVFSVFRLCSLISLAGFFI